MKKIILAILVFAFAITLGAKETPWSAWRNAYTEFEQAEKARDAGDYVSAAKGFKKALELYEFVRKERPDWNQKVIVRRIADCKQELSKIQSYLEPNAPATGKTAPGTTTPSAPKQVAPPKKVDSAEVAALKKKISDLELELATLRQKEKSRRDLESEIALLIRDQHLAKEKQALLEEKLRQAEQKGSTVNDETFKDLQNQLLQSKMECEALRGKLAEAENQIRISKAEAEKYLSQRKFAESAVVATQEKLLRQERETADIRRAEEANRGVREKLEAELAKLQKEHAQVVAALKENQQLLAATQEKMRQLASDDQKSGVIIAEANRDLTQKLNALQLRYDQLDAAFRDLRQRATADQALAEQMKALAERSEATRRMLEKQQSAQEKQLAELRQETTEQMKEIAALKTRIASLSGDLQTAVAQKDLLAKRLQQRDADDYRGAADVAAKQKEWQAERAKLQQSIATQEGEIARLQHLLKDKESALTTLTQARDKIAAEKTALQQEVSNLLETQKQLLAIEKNFHAAQAELRNCRAQLEVAQKEHKELLALRQMQKQVDQIKSKLSEEEKLSAELADANVVLTARLAEALKLKDEVIKLRAEAAKIAELRATVERLKKLNQELAKYRDLEQELAAAKQTIIALRAVQSKLDSALRQQSADQQKIASLQQELTQNQTNFTQLQTTCATQQRELELLRRQWSELQSAKAAEEKAARDQQGKQESQQMKEAFLHEKIAAQEKELAAAKQELNLRQLRLAEAEQSLRELREKSLPQQVEIDKMRAQLGAMKDLENRLAQMTEKSKLAEREISQLRELNESLIKAHSSGKELELLKTRLAEAESFRSEVERLRLLNEELRRENKDLELAVLKPADNTFQFDSAAQLLETPEVLVAQGMRAEKESRVATAIWYYENALKKAPEHAFAAKRLGILLLAREEFERASGVLKIANRLAPKDPEVAIAAARAANACQRYGSALVYLDALLKEARPGKEVLLAAADAQAGSGKRAKAEELLQLAVRYYQSDLGPSLALARFLADDVTREEEALQLYESLRVRGALPDPKLEIRFAGRLDERRELANFLNAAADESADRNDWATAIWYRRQAAEMKRNEAWESAQLAFARYMNGETAAALEEISLHRASVEGELIAALCHLRDGDQTAFLASLNHAKSLNRNAMIDLPVSWRHLLVELKKNAVQEKGKAILQFVR